MSTIENRKAEHLRINLHEDVSSRLSTGLERLRFVHNALPEIDLDDVDLSTSLCGHSLRLPLLISSMTGGCDEAEAVNLALATAAEQTGVAMALGSGRAVLEDPELLPSFDVRRVAPTTLLFANLGAVQLNYGVSPDDCCRLVDLLKVDGLILHLNPLQEALQAEGDTNFSGLIDKIGAVCQRLPVPVIAKEVGWGISGDVAKRLCDVGTAAIDVAGAGGTSWSQVEMHRSRDPLLRNVAAAFSDWGIPTAESLAQIRHVVPEAVLIASGGLTSGIDIAKCVALGATATGLARPFLKAAEVSVEEVLRTISQLEVELRTCMFAVGACNLANLRQVKLLDPD